MSNAAHEVRPTCTFIATMDVPQKKKGDISNNADPTLATEETGLCTDAAALFAVAS